MNHKIRHELNKGLLFFFILVIVPILIIVYSILTSVSSLENLTREGLLQLLVFIIPVVLIYFLCIRTYYNSYYVIDGSKLMCRLGIFKTSLDIAQINYILKREYPIAGNRPALNLQGLKVIYGHGSSIFLSPLDEEKFVKDLQAVKSSIELR
jgi:hypothetical protein